MDIKESFRREEVWYRKALLISMYHIVNSITNKEWTIKHTAKELGLSTGLICEDLQLAEAILENKNLTQLSRNGALKELRKIK